MAFKSRHSNLQVESEPISSLQLRFAKYTIGWPGATGVDHVFAAAADKVEQGIQLGTAAIIPKFGRVVDVVIACTENFTGSAGDEAGFGCEIGTASGGAQYAASANVDDVDDLNYTASGASFLVAPSASATSVYVSATPTTNNFSELTAGKIKCYIIYVDNNY